MRYIVTCDLVPGSESIVFWPEDTLLSLDDDGFWAPDKMRFPIDEMDAEDFKARYKLELAPGEKKLINIVVNWLDEGEDNG